jgi:pyruvate formate lyase activating enzyme
MDTETLIGEVMKDRDFFDGTGGGVTFSGGEPVAQPEFLFACARALKERGVHTAVETSGYWPGGFKTELERSFDLILFDLKHVDPERCRKTLGVSNSSALENLRGLLATKQDLELRITVVPGFNDSAEDLTRIAEWLEQCERLPTIRLQPFHRMAAAKQDLLQRTYPYALQAPLTQRQLFHAAALFAGRGIAIETL